MTKLLKISSKKQVKHMAFSQIKKKNKIMIILVMLHLKVVVADKVVVSVGQISLIFLKIFSVILGVTEDLEVEEILATEVPI